MKTWLVKRFLVAVIMSLTTKAAATESLDLSKALSASAQEQQEAVHASKEKVLEEDDESISVDRINDKMVVDLRDENS